MNARHDFAGVLGAHLAVDHADDLMTVTVPLDAMPADARSDFLRACRSIAAAHDVTLRVVRNSQH